MDVNAPARALRSLARYGAGLVALVSAAAVGAAPLYSVWQLQPMGPLGEMQAVEGSTFLQQRLVPYRMVRLTEKAQWSKKSALDAGTYLFAVWQDDGRMAWCTTKDQSGGHVAKSLFIPMLDRRPCLVDQDGDGRFDSYFTVFDKYGSALTPSGNLASAKALVAPAAYASAPPAEFPVVRAFGYSLANLTNPQRRAIAVTYDNGGGAAPMVNTAPNSAPDALVALNLVAHILSVEGQTAQINVETIPGIFAVGDSGGTFGAARLPSFVAAAGE